MPRVRCAVAAGDRLAEAARVIVDLPLHERGRRIERVTALRVCFDTAFPGLAATTLAVLPLAVAAAIAVTPG